MTSRPAPISIAEKTASELSRTTATASRQRALTPALANRYAQKKKVFGNILSPQAVWISAQVEPH